MSLSQVLLEGRKDDFLKKYSDKFNQEQMKEIFLVSRGLSPNQKFLMFLGNVIGSENFKEDIEKAKNAVEKFIKYQQVLDKKDINQYDSLNDIITAINAHENKTRRTVEDREDADVVFENDRFTVLSPKTYKSSCYYGAGSKWCTASQNTSTHFDNYNIDGKLFYFIDKKAKSNDIHYKVALLQKYDGDKSYWDVKDKNFNSGWILGTPLYDEIQNKIDEYLQNTYSREIEIFKDELAADIERRRIRIQQQDERNARRLATAEQRKENDEWNLDEYDDDMARKANAVFEVIRDVYGISVDEEVGESIYNLIPTEYPHYGLLTFEWLGDDETGTEWAVGDWDEVYEAAKEYQQGIWDDMGVEGWNRDFIMNYIDTVEIERYLEDLFEYDVESNPEVYFDDDLPLAEWQESEIEKLEEEYETLEEIFLDDDYEQDDRDAAEERMEEIEEEIQNIKDDPQGEPTVGMISDMVESLVSDRMDDIPQTINEYGIDINEYIDVEQMIEDSIDVDGTGNSLGTYDGGENEALINGKWYYVYRTN